MFKKLVQPFFFLLGIVLLVYTIRVVGIKELKEIFSLLKGPAILVLFFYPFVSFWDAWGWQFVFPEAVRKKARIRDLFLVRLAGEALNNLIPLADWGGEPLKISLLRSHLGFDKHSSIASVILAKSVLFYSEVIFWIMGLVPAFMLPALTSDWKHGFLLVFSGCILFGALLITAQSKGLFHSFRKLFGKLGVKYLDSVEDVFSESDRVMKSFYSHPKRGFIFSLILHWIGWVAGGVETYLMLQVINANVGFMESLALEALLQMTRTATFFIPGSLGVQEAGMAVYFTAFGHSAPLGVALSLLKRVRQLIWSAAGLAVWGFYELARTANAPKSSAGRR